MSGEGYVGSRREVEDAIAQARGGVEGLEPRELDLVLGELDRLRAVLDRLRMTAQGAARRLDEGDVPGARFVLRDDSVTS